MGASSWSYVVDDETNAETAFRALQAKVLEETGGGTLQERVERAGEGGTHSILDMVRVVDGPAPPPLDFKAMFVLGEDGALIVPEGAVAQLMANPGSIFKMSEDELRGCLQTSTPSAANIAAFMSAHDANLAFIERGTGRYTAIFAGDQPSGVWFVGVSGD